MRNWQICVFALLVTAFFESVSRAQAGRTFRNTDGKTLEGEVLSVAGGKVEIRRLPDGGIFNIPIASLSLDDRKFLLDWMRQEKVRAQSGAGLPEGWATLRIHAPLGIDTVYSSALSLAINRTGGKFHEGDIPIGSWINLGLKRNIPPHRGFRSLYLQFNGNPEWRLSLREGKLYRSFQTGGPAEVIAAAIPGEGELAFVESLRAEPLAARVSFEVQSEAGFKALEALGHPVAGLFFDEALPWQDSLLALAPQALSMGGGDDLLNTLSRVPSLEHLILDEPRSESWTLPAFQSLKDLPRLKSLSMIKEGSPNLEFLEGFDHLRTLSIFGSGRDGAPLKFPKLETLEALSVSRIFSIDPASLVRLPRIRFLNAKGVGPAYEPPDELTMVSWEVEGGDYNTSIGKGFYPNLRFLNTVEHVDYGRLQNLSTLRIVGITPDLANLAKAPKLRHLQLYEIQQVELEQLVNLPNMSELESIRLSRGKLKDLAPLAALRKLRKIELSLLSESPIKIDLSSFPELQYFRAFEIYQLESVTGVASHPNLTHLELMNCRALKSLGNPDPNNRLDTVFLTNAKPLENLDALKKTTGLKAVHLWGCDGLSEPLEIEAANELEYLLVRDSGGLRTRP